MIVSTPRLDLVSLSPPLVAALVAKDLDAARSLGSFRIEDDTFAGDEYVLGLRHQQLLRDPTEEPWLFRAGVQRETGLVVGKVGFHAPPDAEGAVEIGYRVAPAYRLRGFAFEMARGLLAWAAEQGACTCIASVRPDNAPSLCIIERLGFVRTGEQIDEIDGLEWVFTRSLKVALPPQDDRR